MQFTCCTKCSFTVIYCNKASNRIVSKRKGFSVFFWIILSHEVSRHFPTHTHTSTYANFGNLLHIRCTLADIPLQKTNEGQEQHNTDNDIYDTSGLEHEFEYGIYEDVFKTEQLMAELKRIDEAERESKKLRDLEFKDFPLEQFSDAGKVANERDPHLKAAADTKLYDLEKCAIQIDIDNNNYQNSSENTDDNSSPSAEEICNPNIVSHMQPKTVGNQYHVEHDDNTLHKTVYRPTYVPYNEDGQKLLLPQTTDMSHKDNLKLLYNSLPEGMCDTEYESLEQGNIDSETFQYSHETSTKHVLVQGVYVGSASVLIADIKTQPYSVITYMDNGMLTGTHDNTHDIPIYI